MDGIVLIGFGNQGCAWAQNLRDQGREVVVALREGSQSKAQAQALGFSVISLDCEQDQKELASFSTILLLLPDHTHTTFLQTYGKHFASGARIIYAHGFSRCSQKSTAVDHFHHLLLAPKAIASELRAIFLQKEGVLGAVYALDRTPHFTEEEIECDRQFLIELAHDIGINVGPFESSFSDECRADLFSEQSLLCSLLPYAAKESFELLVSKGISPELAYFECWYELKLIANTMVEMGPQKFFELISPNALVGGLKGRRELLGKEFRNSLQKLWNDIDSGNFSQEAAATDIEACRKEIASEWNSSLLQQLHDRFLA
ncbi:MAG: hypothetical protein HQK50_03290 [Oligoflexia bacterium]|nr:hypothetical protein [Oligoflexia bacterium]